MADTTTKKYVQKLNDYLIRDDEAHTKIAALEAADKENFKLSKDQTITGSNTYTGEATYTNRFTLKDYFSFQEPNGQYMVNLMIADEGSGTNNNLVIPVKSGTLATTDDIVNEVAKIINDSDPDDIDTLEEIAAWIKNDTTGAAALANKINEAVTDITNLQTADSNNVKKDSNGVSQTIKAKLNVQNLIIPNTSTSSGIGFGTIDATQYALKAKELPTGVSGPITISLPQATKNSTLITQEMLGVNEKTTDPGFYEVKYARHAVYGDDSGNTISEQYATKEELRNVKVAATYTISTKTLNFTNVAITEN